MSRKVTSDDDYIYSLDIIERLAELEADNAEEPFEPGSDEFNEYASLKAFADSAEDAEDWQYGATFIRESYTAIYAQEYANELGLDSVAWPFMHIDWEAAADDLLSDWQDFEFNGVTYYAR